MNKSLHMPNGHSSVKLTGRKASFTLSRCTPRCVPAVCSRRTGANRDESGKNSCAFIYSRQCYGPDPVWGKNRSRSIPVMLRFACVHSRCSSGGATVYPGASRYTTVLPRASEPRCNNGESRKPRCFTVAFDFQWIFHETYNRNVLCKIQNSSYLLRQKKNSNVRWREDINCISNETLPPYPHLSIIMKLFGILKIT